MTRGLCNGVYCKTLHSCVTGSKNHGKKKNIASSKSMTVKCSKVLEVVSIQELIRQTIILWTAPKSQVEKKLLPVQLHDKGEWNLNAGVIVTSWKFLESKEMTTNFRYFKQLLVSGISEKVINCFAECKICSWLMTLQTLCCSLQWTTMKRKNNVNFFFFFYICLTFAYLINIRYCHKRHFTFSCTCKWSLLYLT